MVKAHEMNIQEQDIIVDVLNTIVEIAKKTALHSMPPLLLSRIT